MIQFSVTLLQMSKACRQITISNQYSWSDHLSGNMQFAFYRLQEYEKQFYVSFAVVRLWFIVVKVSIEKEKRFQKFLKYDKNQYAPFCLISI